MGVNPLSVQPKEKTSFWDKLNQALGMAKTVGSIATSAKDLMQSPTAKPQVETDPFKRRLFRE